MRVGRQGFALGAEISVMAYRALVSDTREIARERPVLAQWPITENAVVDFMMLRPLSYRLIDWNKAMAWMGACSICKASRAVIPIRTGQALVADANNTLRTLASDQSRFGQESYLFTAIANSGMLIMAPRAAARKDKVLQAELPVTERGKGVGRMMSMFALEEAGRAEVKVLTGRTTDHIRFTELCTTSGSRRAKKYQGHSYHEGMHCKFARPLW